MNLMDSVSATPANLTNGAITSYIITFRSTKVPLANNDILFFTFPNEITLGSNPSCSGSTNINTI